MVEWLPGIHPSLVLVIGAAVVALAPRRLGAPIFVAASVVAGLFILGLSDTQTWGYNFYGYDLTVLRADGLSLAFSYVFAIALIAGGVFGIATMGTLERSAALVYAASAFGVVFAGDVVTLFFFWELKVSGSALLIFARRSPVSSAAGLRYLIFSLAGGIVLLAGIVWWVIGTGSIEFTAFNGGETGLGALSGAAILILIGFLVAAAAVPLHAWMPDAYPTATIAGTVFLAAFTSKAAVYALARGFPGTGALIWIGVIMALYGVVFALSENDLRRALTYSSVSQGGFMLAAIGVGTTLAINGAVAHAFAHITYKGLLLMAAGAVMYATGRSRLTQLGGLGRAMPWVAGLYLVGAAAIGSFPLFSGFVSKEMSLLALTNAEYEVAYWLLKLASVGTLLVVALRLPWFTWFAPASTATAAPPARMLRPVPVSMYVAMGALAAVNVAIGVVPGWMYAVLPNEVDYSPFAGYRIADAMVLIVGAAVVFWLLRDRLAGRPVTLVDTDWVYRELPRPLLERTASWSLPTLTLPRPTLPVVPGWTASMWFASAVILTAIVVVLGVGVVL